MPFGTKSCRIYSQVVYASPLPPIVTPRFGGPVLVVGSAPISHKPAEVRMGNGKGNPEYWVAEIVPGKVLYEMDGVDEASAREAFRLASAKLPLLTTFVHRMVGG